MKILIIDDDEYKRRQINEFLREVTTNSQVQEARSLQSGLKAILAGGHDLIILDMTMPTFDITAEEDGGRPQAYGGRELLRHMKRREIQTPTVVVTQFDRFGEGRSLLTIDELHRELKTENTESYYGTIHYNVSYESWKDDLKGVINRVLEKTVEL